MPKAIGVIPARLHSTRFPKKILHHIEGKPMVVHVYERAKKAKLLEDVIIAIDSKETELALKPFKVKTVMTSNNHISGTDRVEEVSRDIEVDIIVNIQGDEPMIDPKLIDILVEELSDSSIELATVGGMKMDAKGCDNKIQEDRHCCKNKYENIDTDDVSYYQHMGIYAYRKTTLERFVKLEASENEKELKLEQYRALDNNIPIKVILIEKVFKGIDTMDDLNQLKAI